ncbi:MAG: Na+/H+ antiporter subunit D [Ilumatobacter sp.]|uniref:Na+/H+ antiporter subunit D n=1 Tax=Ilumatobacter sp. TaxID=1967498 RepID=UPI00261EEB2B|nr:Na+/H+ antiporter subunit D [Ilumatobacter sp.]MDJ0769119.1 Na+/H+ antiporter subunit D [Ilumatobacter sp.]
MSTLVPLPVVVPLIAAALSIVTGRFRAAQRVISVGALTAVFGVSIALLVGADDDGFVVHRSGGWPASIGISLVVDRLAGLMLVVSSLVLLAVLLYAIGQAGEESRRVGFHPVYLVLAAGVSASFVTADLFNLFVAFEMMLAASYVLITFGGRPDQVRSGMSYVVISLVASTLFITMLALLYASTGTVNMADLAVRLGEVDPGVRNAFALALLVVFGIKAGLFPLFFWLPDSYPTAPGPVTAIFAGLLTKVGVYAIIRTQTLLFDTPDWMGTVLVVVAVLTMVVGVLGAIAQDDMKRILAFHIISQIGYMIFGLGLFTVAGVAGAVFYIVHHIIVKTALFLVSGLVARRAGSSRLSEVGGLVRSAPIVAVLFAVPALSLAGLPPFSGFLAKFALVDAGLDASSWIAVAASLAVGMLTLFSMTKIWSGAFWGEPDEEPRREPRVQGRLGVPLGMALPTAVLALASIAVSIWAGALYDVSERASLDLLDPGRYVEAILEVEP